MSHAGDEDVIAEDERTLRSLGYKQELRRGMGAFSNFAISLSIICILAGGVTSFHQGLSSVGGAAFGLGWPLVCLFSLAVAATMGQVASSFPTAGGLYHWASILGGKGWGWATAWLNLLGMVAALAAINLGALRFTLDSLGPGPASATVAIVGVFAITASQALVNHLGIRLTTRLTDFSGYWIVGIALLLTASMLVCAPSLHPERLVSFTNYSGARGGGVWPATDSIPLLFVLSFLLAAYTITGFDASANTAEETVGAAVRVPRGIIQAVAVSGVAGWVMLCAVVAAIPDLDRAAALGPGAFTWTVGAVLPRPLAYFILAGIAVAQYLCGLAAVTSASRIAYAFARDGGLPASKALGRVSDRYRAPTMAIWTVALAAALARRHQRGRMPRPHRDRHAPTEREEHLDHRRCPPPDGDHLVRGREGPLRRPAGGAGRARDVARHLAGVLSHRSSHAYAASRMAGENWWGPGS